MYQHSGTIQPLPEKGMVLPGRERQERGQSGLRQCGPSTSILAVIQAEAYHNLDRVLVVCPGTLKSLEKDEGPSGIQTL